MSNKVPGDVHAASLQTYLENHGVRASAEDRGLLVAGAEWAPTGSS